MRPKTNLKLPKGGARLEVEQNEAKTGQERKVIPASAIV